MTLWFLLQFFKLKGLGDKITLPWSCKWQIGYLSVSLISFTRVKMLTCVPMNAAQATSFMWKNIFPNCKITFDKTANLQGSRRFSWSKHFFKDIPERPLDRLSWYHYLLIISTLILHIFFTFWYARGKNTYFKYTCSFFSIEMHPK